MSIDNLGAFNTYRDESDGDDEEFDAKQSGRFDATLNAFLDSKPSASEKIEKEDDDAKKKRALLADAAEK